MHHDEAFLRRAAEAKARVPGLVPEDLEQIETVAPNRSAPIVCFCADGNRGAIAAAALLDHGYPNVQTLERGLGGVPDRLLEKG